MSKKEIPIWEKSNLTLEEAAAYFGIGINKLREMTDERAASTFSGWGQNGLSSVKSLTRFWNIYL